MGNEAGAAKQDTDAEPWLWRFILTSHLALREMPGGFFLLHFFPFSRFRIGAQCGFRPVLDLYFFRVPIDTAVGRESVIISPFHVKPHESHTAFSGSCLR